MITYAGFLPIDLAGDILQVTFSVTGSGTTMTLCQNTERTHNVIPYPERRVLEKAREVRKLMDANRTGDLRGA